MVKDYYQLINDDLKYIFTGDDDGLREKVNKELGGDMEQAKKLILEDIANGETKIQAIKTAGAGLDKKSIEYYEGLAQIANIELGIARAKKELDKVSALDKSKLKIYAFERVEL